MLHTLNNALRQAYGCKVYKLALHGGDTCPNRDGTKSVGGCRFCGAAGGGAFASADTQEATRRVAHKGAGKYIAYFQSYSATYGPLAQMEARFSAAIAQPEVVALSIATRPDCLPPAVLSLLERLNRQKPVWVELGLQTIHPATALAMNRCFSLADFDEAVLQLNARGLTVVAHMILGLPGETAEMMLDTADYIAHCGAQGVKFHLLHILDNAPLARDWAAGAVRVLEMDEYISLLAACVRRMPPEMVIHRLTGDGEKRHLLAPLWSGDKKRVLNEISRHFVQAGVVQGAQFSPGTQTELLTVFDEAFQPTATAIRERVHAQGLLHEVVHCWIVSRRADGLHLWFQQRAATKRDYPNCYDLAVGGHVGAGEDAADALLREIREEVGLHVLAGQLHALGVSRETMARRAMCDHEFARIYVVFDDAPDFHPGEEVSRMVRIPLAQFLLWLDTACAIEATAQDGAPVHIENDDWAGYPTEFRAVVYPFLQSKEACP